VPDVAFTHASFWLLAGVVAGIVFMANCGGPSGPAPVNANHLAGDLVVHVAPVPVPAHPIAPGTLLGVTIQSFVFTPPQAGDLLLSLTIQGALAAPSGGGALDLTVRVGASGPFWSASTSLPDTASPTPFTWSVPFEGLWTGLGAGLPPGAYGVEVAARNSSGVPIQISGLEVRLLVLQQPTVENPTTRTAGNPLAVDDDNDGFSENAGDCNDSDPAIHPGAVEVSGNGIDEDCDGTVDGQTWFRDADSDNFGDATVTMVAGAQPPGFVSNDNDCYDSDPAINPGAVEIGAPCRDILNFLFENSTAGRSPASGVHP
jgi:hypothetical protein